jgi:hypothetical protein
MARTGPAEGNDAYLAAAATTQFAMQGGPAAFWPFDRPSGEQLQPLLDTLHDTAEAIWPPEAREGSPDTMVVFAEAQHKLSQHSAQACAEALQASFPPPPQLTTARGPGPNSSAAPAALPPPGWILSPPPEPYSSKAGSSTPASDTALASPCFPQMLPMCNVAAGPPSAAPTPRHAMPWRHRPDYTMTSRQGFCAVLCTGRALPPQSSTPSTTSPVSPKALAHPPPVPPPTQVLEGTSSWPCPKASPSPTCPASTPSPSTPSLPPPHRQEWPWPGGTTRSEQRMWKWSRKATPSFPFLCSHMDVSDNRQSSSCISSATRPRAQEAAHERPSLPAPCVS